MNPWCVIHSLKWSEGIFDQSMAIAKAYRDQIEADETARQMLAEVAQTLEGLHPMMLNRLDPLWREGYLSRISTHSNLVDFVWHLLGLGQEVCSQIFDSPLLAMEYQQGWVPGFDRVVRLLRSNPESPSLEPITRIDGEAWAIEIQSASGAEHVSIAMISACNAPDAKFMVEMDHLSDRSGGLSSPVDMLTFHLSGFVHQWSKGTAHCDHQQLLPYDFYLRNRICAPLSLCISKSDGELRLEVRRHRPVIGTARTFNTESSLSIPVSMSSLCDLLFCLVRATDIRRSA